MSSSDSTTSATYSSMEDYLAQLEKRRANEQAPTAAVFLLPTLRTLEAEVNGLPWINRVRCELPSRPLGPDDEEPPTVATLVTLADYYAAANPDSGLPEAETKALTDARYRAIKERLAVVGVAPVHRVLLCDPDRRDEPIPERALRGLERSDLVLIDLPPNRFDGALHAAWLDMAPTDLGGRRPEGLSERVKWRYYAGAVLIGVGGGATLLGDLGVGSCLVGPEENSADVSPHDRLPTFEPFQIVPAAVGNDDEVLSKASVGKLGSTVAFHLSGQEGGLVFNTDGTFEPVRTVCWELRTNYDKDRSHGDPDEVVKRAALLPPKTDENVVVACSRWLKDQGRTGTAALDDEEDEDEDHGPEPTMGELRLGLPPRPTDPAARAEAARVADARRAEGGRLVKTGRFEQALVEYAEAVRADPYDPRHRTNASFCALKLGRVREALLAADAALWLTDGGSAKAYFRRAQAFRAAGDVEEALADLDKARAAAPDDAGVKKLRDECVERREGGAWSYAADRKKTPRPPSVELCEDLEAFDGHALVFDGVEGASRRVVAPEDDRENGAPVERRPGANLDPRAAWVLAALTRRAALERLELSYARVGVRGASSLAKGARDAADAATSNLRRLVLRGCRLRDEGCAVVAALLSRGVPLVELDLSDNGLTDVERLADALRRDDDDDDDAPVPRLESLDLSRNRVGDGTAVGELGRRLADVGSLVSLDLSRNRLGLRSVGDLCRRLVLRTDALRTLSLARNPPLRADALWRVVGVAVGHASLRSVDLRGVRITDADRREIARRTRYTMVQFRVDGGAETRNADATTTTTEPFVEETTTTTTEETTAESEEVVVALRDDDDDWVNRIPRMGLF